jgi:Putative F0F1-ATPase subunit Ca2+/Mg2+ transporter
MNPYLKYSSLAMQMFATIGIAAWLGHKADLYFGFKFPVFLLSLVLISFGGIMYKLYISITKEK